jgi:hypothetical protein
MTTTHERRVLKSQENRLMRNLPLNYEQVEDNDNKNRVIEEF